MKRNLLILVFVFLSVFLLGGLLSMIQSVYGVRIFNDFISDIFYESTIGAGGFAILFAWVGIFIFLTSKDKSTFNQPVKPIFSEKKDSFRLRETPDEMILFSYWGDVFAGVLITLLIISQDIIDFPLDLFDYIAIILGPGLFLGGTFGIVRKYIRKRRS